MEKVWDSNHALFFLNISLDAFEPFVHHAAVEGKQVHVLLHLLLLPVLLSAVLHHAAQLTQETVLWGACLRAGQVSARLW